MKLIINEQHNLAPRQLSQLNLLWDEWETVSVPATGWDLPHMERIRDDLRSSIGEAIVFVSPIPALLGWLAATAKAQSQSVYVFHNDTRVAKEITNPDGSTRIIHTLDPEGWLLVRVA